MFNFDDVKHYDIIYIYIYIMKQDMYIIYIYINILEYMII